METVFNIVGTLFIINLIGFVIAFIWNIKTRYQKKQSLIGLLITTIAMTLLCIAINICNVVGGLEFNIQALINTIIFAIYSVFLIAAIREKVKSDT